MLFATRSYGEKMAKILIAEDDADNLYILTELLGGEGYEIAVAVNAADAISAARRERPDLILMDLQMPDSAAAAHLNSEAGLEAARTLTADPQTRSIPVMALTGFDAAAGRTRIEAAGCAAVATKPYDFTVLLRSVAELLGRA